jgi:hypothetical protein
MKAHRPVDRRSGMAQRCPSSEISVRNRSSLVSGSSGYASSRFAVFARISRLA